MRAGGVQIGIFALARFLTTAVPGDRAKKNGVALAEPNHTLLFLVSNAPLV